MSDIEEIKKAQIFLLEAHIDDVVLNAKEYPENTKENAKEWIYLSSVLKAYSNQQQQTIDKLTKEVEGLKEEKLKGFEEWHNNKIKNNRLTEENTKIKGQLKEWNELPRFLLQQQLIREKFDYDESGHLPPWCVTRLIKLLNK